MRFKMFFSIITILLYCKVFAINVINKDELARMSLSLTSTTNESLAKKTGPSATSYTSSYFNISFTCPSGWTITAFDSTPTSFSMTVTKSLRANIHIDGKKFLTPVEARYYNDVSCFLTGKIAYNNSEGKMPGIYSVWDTSYSSSGTASVGINLKYAMDANNIYQSQCNNASESFSIYQHEYWYFTTTSDYSSNNSEYSQLWLNLSFKNSTIAKQAVTKITSDQSFTLTNNTIYLTPEQQKALKLDLFNILGERIKNIYNSEKSVQNAIDLNNSVSASSNYFLKATTPNGSNYYKIFIK